MKWMGLELIQKQNISAARAEPMGKVIVVKPKSAARAEPISAT
ncbi:hypothetical protein KSZ_72860 [Dictyobacter formicarum]|uniref:10 kDa chaperonin n=1 Tax=Dictyobacter formicarum TaxID=2778368 RepID=A0ABQ3VTZ3_9CHLR|nr:hypothetical protein KSZ_72860 [Dictyobacter formicarum]